MVPSHNVPTIISSAGGYVKHRLSIDNPASVLVEEFTVQGMDRDHVDWGAPRSLISFATPAEAWLHVGKLLGWVEETDVIPVNTEDVDQAVEEMQARFEAEKEVAR